MRRLNFTGSTATGRKLAEAAGRRLKRVVLELGGYNPLIVLADADLEYAVNATTFGAFLHQGQICMSARRIIVERSIADEFVAPPRGEDERPQGRRPVGARHDHRPAHQPRRARDGAEPGRRGRERRREGPRRRERRGTVLPGDASCRRARRLGVRERGDVRPGRRDRGRRLSPRRRSRAPTPRRTGSRRGSSRRTPTAGSSSRRRSTQGSSTSTTSRSATSRRCRSAA